MSSDGTPRLSKLRADVGAMFEKLAENMQFAGYFSRGILVIGGALAVGITQIPAGATALTASLSTLETGFPWGKLVGMAGVGFVAVGGVWGLLAEKPIPKLLETARKAADEALAISAEFKRKEADAKAELNGLKEELEDRKDTEYWLSMLYTTSSQLRETAENLISLNSAEKNTLEEACQALLNSVNRHLQELMDLDGGEFWTITIYKETVDSAGIPELSCFATVRSDRVGDAHLCRKWGITHGVVGRCYETAEEVLIADLGDPSVRPLVHSPVMQVEGAKSSEEHKSASIEENKSQALTSSPVINFGGAGENGKRYVSFAAVPVRIAGEQAPWAVVIATSDLPDRFSARVTEESIGFDVVEPVRMLAGAIALLSRGDYKKEVD